MSREVEQTMYDRILAIDASPDSPDDSLNRTAKFAQMTGGTVYLLHVACGQNIPSESSVGSDIGVPTAEDIDVRERKVVQDAVNQLAAAGIDVHGELVEATEHDAADVIQRARDLDVDIMVLG